MGVRSMKESDFPSIQSIFVNVFDRHEDLAFEKAWKNCNYDLSLVYESKEDVYGFLLVSNTHLEFLGVDPRAQGNGIGTTLLHSLLDKCKRRLVNLTLVPSNNSPTLVRWYLRHGFAPLAYKEGELWMQFSI